jgi:hypothetical protein
MIIMGIPKMRTGHDDFVWQYFSYIFFSVDRKSSILWSQPAVAGGYRTPVPQNWRRSHYVRRVRAEVLNRFFALRFPSRIRLPGPELPISTERYELRIIAPVGPLRERKRLLEDRPLRIQEFWLLRQIDIMRIMRHQTHLCLYATVCYAHSIALTRRHMEQ